MSNSLLEYRKQMYYDWVYEQINIWLHEYGAWDALLEDEDNDFDEDDLEFIRNRLFVADIVIKEIGE